MSLPDAVTISAQVRSRERSAVDIAQGTLADIEDRDREINAFTFVLHERALADARRVDAQIAAGQDPGPLAGVPFAVKDLFDVAGETTCAGSAISADDPPAARDAAVLTALRNAGGVLVGKLAMDEYAYGFVTDNSHFGPCRNPHDTTRTAGGSSGGAGAAVAAGFVPFAVGSDTNGSARVPAALCGVYGLKPTFGALSCRGMYPLSRTLDHVGVLAGTAADVTAVYGVLGEDSLATACDTSGLRFAVADGYFARRGSAEALEAVDVLAEAIGVSERLTLAGAELSRAAAMVITAAEGAALHLEHLRRDPQRFDPMTRERFLAGAMVPASAYVTARAFRGWFCDHLDEVFSTVDVLLAPATPFAAPKIGATEVVVDGRAERAVLHLGLYTAPFSFAGLPVLSVPVGSHGGLPLGVQLVGARGSEHTLLALAGELQSSGYVRPNLLPCALG